MHLLRTLVFWPMVAWAIQITTPATNSTWDPSQTQIIQFEAVSTDLTQHHPVNILLVNQVVFPPVSITLINNVNIGSHNTATLDPTFFSNHHVVSQAGYQINIVDSITTGILAQSGTFSIIAITSSSSQSSTTTTSVPGPITTTSTTSSSSITSPPLTTSTTSTTRTTSTSSITTTSTNVAGKMHEADVGVFLAAVVLGLNGWL